MEDPMRKRGRVATERGVLFRENALGNAGYALTFGKLTSLLVIPSEFLWLTHYPFWRETQRDVLKHG